MLAMLTHEEHQAMIMFDRLLMAAKDNETVADLLDQTLNVARMIDPRPEEKISYGPLQRMHFEWQQMKHRMGEIEKKMDNYINQLNRTGTTPTWPSNPGLGTAYPLTASSTGSYQHGYGAVPPSTWNDTTSWSIGGGGETSGLSFSDIQDLVSKLNQTPQTVSIKLDNEMEEVSKDIAERLNKIRDSLKDQK
jgi:hypothetical protein